LIRVAFLLVLSLSGCVASPPATYDNVAIVWNRVEEPHRVCEALSGRKNFFNVLGCSHWIEPVAQGAPRTCSIYAPMPRNERDTQRFATLGHELMHCFDGNWHDRWGRMHSPNRDLAGDPGSAASGGTSPTPQ
jgi:hypothetical protein